VTGKLRLVAALTLILALCQGASLAQAGHVELHAHVFMKEGMSWMFRGRFDEPLRARTYKDGLSSQINAEALESSGASIVVVALYAHPWLTWSLQDSIRRQIALAEDFVRNHGGWIIARSASDARAALKAGKRVLVFSLEGASGILETEQDFQEFVVRRGIRIVTPLHLTDDGIGGVAFLKGYRVLASPLAWLRSLIVSREHDGAKANSRGLSAEGHEIIKRLLRYGVWIDLAHSSDQSQEEILAEMTTAYPDRKLPLLYTHTVLRKYHGAERGVSELQLQRVRDSGGYIGLMPSEEMLDGTPVPRELCPVGCSADACEGSVHALATQFREASLIVGAPSVALGSDYNGAINHLKPSCGTKTILDQEGLWNFGQAGSIWQAMKALNAPVPEPESLMVDQFLDAWSRIRETP